MKNSKLLIILLICIISKVTAQTIGDHLNFIRQEEPGGKFDYKAEGGSTYKYMDAKTETMWLYFLNVDLECIAIAAHPSKPIVLQAMIEQLNHEWVIVDVKHWLFYKNDGSIIAAELDNIDNVGSVIYISEAKSSN